MKNVIVKNIDGKNVNIVYEFDHDSMSQPICLSCKHRLTDNVDADTWHCSTENCSEFRIPYMDISCFINDEDENLYDNLLLEFSESGEFDFFSQP